METFARLIADFNQFLWGPPLLFLLVGVHIFLTFRLKFIQRYIPLGIKLSIRKDANSSGMISNFGALSIALAATIGTGNIIGKQNFYRFIEVRCFGNMTVQQRKCP